MHRGCRGGNKKKKGGVKRAGARRWRLLERRCKPSPSLITGKMRSHLNWMDELTGPVMSQSLGNVVWCPLRRRGCIRIIRITPSLSTASRQSGLTRKQICGLSSELLEVRLQLYHLLRLISYVILRTVHILPLQTWQLMELSQRRHSLITEGAPEILFYILSGLSINTLTGV